MYLRMQLSIELKTSKLSELSVRLEDAEVKLSRAIMSICKNEEVFVKDVFNIKPPLLIKNNP